MSDNWIVQNLQRALNVWDEKLDEIYSLISATPQSFRDGDIWEVILKINETLQSIAYALLVLFFVVGVIKTCSSLTEIKRPEHALKLFLRFAVAKIFVTFGMELLNAILEIVQGTIETITKASSLAKYGQTQLPDELIAAIEDTSFFESVPLWAISLIASLIVWVLAFTMVLTVYGRFFRIYMYTAIAPLPLSTFASETTSHVAVSFLKSYAGLCLEGAVIVLSCVIFSLFASTPPDVDTEAKAAVMVWSYMGEMIFNMLILSGCIKATDKLIHEMLGL